MFWEEGATTELASFSGAFRRTVKIFDFANSSRLMTSQEFKVAILP